MIWQRNVRDLYREMRIRILTETERYLAHYLAHPEQIVRIPRIKVGEASFLPQFADQFWSEVLGDDASP
jgi:hypothetical protein